VLPLRDDNPTRHRATVTILLIVVNIGVYLLVQPPPSEPTAARFAYEHAAIPCEITSGDPLTAREIVTDTCEPERDLPAFPDKPVFVAVLVSMFLHGNLVHLGGNMLFLWVFGNNIEDRLGPLRYILFYAVAGVAATIAHVALQPESTIPVLGASGAIAGVMGAYLIWFPNAPVLSLFFFVIAPVRARWLLLYWFASQFFVNPNEGIAWGAHVGGFVAGAVIGWVLARGPRLARRD
jgi:membrane associated rhomboid family serine protease